MEIGKYIETINKRFQSGISREHSYRGDLESLLRNLTTGVEITNEPANVTDCGNPDYVIMKGGIQVGFIEAKDIGKDLNSKSFKEQFSRYKKALPNLIITDYIWFQFYQDEKLVHEIRIGEIENGSIISIPENYTHFGNLINDFSEYIGQTIKSPKRLAKLMAGKAKLLQDILENAITTDEQSGANSSLKGQYNTFKQLLIHDLEPSGFADIYAQTIAYGMFAARLHDTTLDDFSRQEAAELIPKSNPFLRKLFGYVAGPDIDDRIITIVDNLASVFRATDIEQLLKNFGRSTQTHDPIIHFYETFLAEYDPKLRKAKGVWYTPEPVVNFIVRAVDDILKTEFDLPQGLADTSKTTIKVKSPMQGSNKMIKKEVHKVQILDPATGTGTFLAEVVKFIYNKNFKSMKGAWSGYVEDHLIPRLNGFELLMASYSMAHLKLDMLLTETGYIPTKNQRFNIYLTNSLEEYSSTIPNLFMQELAEESVRASEIKRDTPVMCVIGNPPYAVSSSNKSDWIQNLIKSYKQGLNERKINLDDDYIKFIRFGQHFIDKNGSGILAYITNNSFIDGITHRQMRKSLLESFDKVYILDLHGYAKLKEVNLIADNDENVFDIQQGVSINIFIKTGKNKENGVVFYREEYGTRNEKYDFLIKNSLTDISWETLKPTNPYFFFVQKDFSEKKNHEKGFKIKSLFVASNSGIKTDRDSLFYDSNKKQLENRFNSLLLTDFDQSFIDNYNVKDSGSYKITTVIKNKKYNTDFIKQSIYRPFDVKWTYYDPGIISRPAQKSMVHFDGHDNTGLIIGRQGQVIGHMQWNLVFITDSLTDYNVFYRGGGYVFPLYSYYELIGKEYIKRATRTPNLNQEIINDISKRLNLTFTNEKEEIKNTFAPIDILDYIYAVLHSPNYREKYKEFLKIDFPRVPYPKDKETFLELVKLGKEIRQIHLLESTKVSDYITSYPEGGDDIITTKIGKKDWEIINEEKQLGRIWLNETQYFDAIPLLAWEFYIGGYQPAQKWLKDRKGRKLGIDDISHYMKIIVALSETDRIMKEIDKIKLEG